MSTKSKKYDFIYTKEEIKEETNKAYSIFYNIMKELNPELSNSTINELFQNKFKF